MPITDGVEVAQVLNVVAWEWGPANGWDGLPLVVHARQAPRQSMVLVNREGSYRTRRAKRGNWLCLWVKRRSDLP